jgi:hypothetical protein
MNGQTFRTVSFCGQVSDFKLQSFRDAIRHYTEKLPASWLIVTEDTPDRVTFQF